MSLICAENVCREAGVSALPSLAVDRRQERTCQINSDLRVSSNKNNNSATWNTETLCVRSGSQKCKEEKYIKINPPRCCKYRIIPTDCYTKRFVRQDCFELSFSFVCFFLSGTEKVPQRTCATRILPNFWVSFLVRFASKPLFYWVVPSTCSENYLVLFVRFFCFGVLFWLLIRGLDVLFAGCLEVLKGIANAGVRNTNKKVVEAFAFVRFCLRLFAFPPLFLFAFVNVCLHLFAFARICLRTLCRAPSARF